MSEIRLDRVSKVFDGDVRAVDDVSLTIESGEFMVLVGPSGCGKSTLLRMIAGLEEVSDGEIWIGEREVSRLAPRDRDIAMVFQNYALYPHLSVAKNLGYGLKVRKTPKAQIDRRVEEVARLLGLEELLDRRPAALSGGQRQRVAMGRAIVREPAAFLMDEPLSNLDAKLRVDMRAELARQHERLGITTIYVTHDQIEAMTLGTRVAVMRDGTIQQVDTPQTLYRQPANLFVAAFIGSPSMNLVEATIEDDVLAFAGFRIPLASDRRPADRASGTVIMGIRPQDTRDVTSATSGLPTIDVEVAVVEDLGSATHVLFTIDAPPVDLAAVRATSDDRELATLMATDRRALFTAEVSETARPRPGDRVTLTIDPGRLHFFDPDTSESLLAPSTAAVAG
ncbi:MAG TPA: sn-glycerol-3-phosphate ABC transporter ATP-binding protein UgpC [Gaiella sp.]|nr:sn-glycerol-3-phosphate ABC transporter ATP-binding protein UgpC [Gaiella sp.]